MATARELSDKEDVELREHNAEMNKFQRDKKEVFKKMEPYNEELERITQLQRECKDKFQHQREEKHERKTNQQLIERLVGLESENKQLKCEIEKLKSENNKYTDLNSKLKQSLDEGSKYSRMQRQKIVELENRPPSTADMGMHLATAAGESGRGVDNCTVSELREQLNQVTILFSETKTELNETQKRLSDASERLAVADQVTAATQLREVREYGISEKLQLEMTPQHHLAPSTGLFSVL